MPPRNFLDGIDQNNIIQRRSRSLSPSKLQTSSPPKQKSNENAPSSTSPTTSSPPSTSNELIPNTANTIKPNDISTQNGKANLYKLLADLNLLLPPPHADTTTSSPNKKVDISKLIDEAITKAFKNFKTSNSNPQSSHQTDDSTKHNSTQEKPLPQHHFPTPASNSNIPQPNHLHRNAWHSEHGLIPIIEKFMGTTDVLEYIEDLETRFLLLPELYSTDRLKVITAVENLAGVKTMTS
ncbi:hypothetical protein EPUL_006506 [Erysiphe pulchra]|uniref:Uncharacterized protein n=1 Tax=Erysiphe pulchra TaxID=225359 RepID=A0A2S4PJ88_9PEZI|nr:hypothetical protein EPUL_006506 [Erysiphe pulchra]